MGWWQIVPETGQPMNLAPASSPKPLNAVPGHDNQEAPCYGGDAPLDTMLDISNELAAIVGPSVPWSLDEVDALFERRVVPPRFGPEQAVRILGVVERFWVEFDDCYLDDWERPALPPERRWALGGLGDQLIGFKN